MTKHARKNNPDSPSQNPDPVIDRRKNEWIFAAIQESLDGKQFESFEEANAFLQERLAAGDFAVKKKTGTTPLEKAKDIMYDAWNAKGSRRIDLAYEALKVSKDCADAYVLLAEEAAADRTEAITFLTEGVLAGERALGPEIFEEEAGHFWGILDTRPYMRARFDLARLLYLDGKKPEAIAHMKDLLRLNPGDNQGVRHELAMYLLEINDTKSLEKLLDEYADEYSAVWLYTRALMKFRSYGKTPETNASLVEAFKQNRFVPLYLLGKKKFPSRFPDYMGIGDENEAVFYAAGGAKAWINTDGALMWMRRIYSAKRRKPGDKKGRS